MMNEFITGLFKVLLLLTLYGVTGYLLLFAFSNKKGYRNSYFTIFMSLFVGLSSVISLVAISLSRGMTVNIILTPVLLYLIYSIRRDKQPIQHNSHKTYYQPLLIVFVGVVLLYTYCYFTFGSNYENQDYLFYSKISYYLFNTGFENDYHIFNLIDKDYNAVTPYHYFDLWLNAINYSAWKTQSNLDTFLRITSTILLVCVFSGFLAIAEIYKRIDFTGILLSFLIIFFGGFYLSFFSEVSILKTFEYCFTPYSVFNFAKFTPTILYFISVFVCLMRVNTQTALLLFSSLTVVSIVNVPGVGLVLSLLFASLLLFKRLREYMSLKKVMIAFVPLLAVVIFYILAGNKTVARGGTTLNTILELIMSLFTLPVMIQKIRIIGGAVLVTIIVYLISFPLIWNFIKSTKDGTKLNELILAVLILVALAGGLLAWSILAPKMNAIQPFYYYLKALPLVLFIIILSTFSDTVSKGFTILILCFGVWNIYQSFNKSMSNTSKYELKEQYEATIKQIPVSGMVGYFKDSTDYTDISSYYPTCYSLGMPFTTHIDALFGVSLSDYSLPVINDPITRKNYEEGISMGAFYRFVQQQKSEGIFKDIESSQLQYIKNHKIKYLLITDNVHLPKCIRTVTDTIIPIPRSNEKIVRLDY